MSERKRAQRGLPQLVQLRNGAWRWRKDYGTDPVTGKRDRPTFERATREAALAAGQAEESRRFRSPGRQHVPAAGTVADHFAEVLRVVLHRPGGSPNTYSNYEGVVRRNIVPPPFGALDVARVTSDDVRKLLSGISSKSGRQAAYKVLSVGWRMAVEGGLVDDPYVVKRAHGVVEVAVTPETPSMVATVHQTNARLDALLRSPLPHMRESMGDQDMAKILKVLEAERLRARFIIGLLVGTRQSESLGMLWTLLQRPTIPEEPATMPIVLARIRDQWAHGCPAPRPCPPGTTPSKCRDRLRLDPIKEPKTAGSTRMLYLGPGVIDLLDDWRARQQLELADAEADVSQMPGWMWTNPDGTPLTHSADRKNWERILRKAQVSRHYSLHDLRRTAASQMAADPSVDPQTLMGVFGWTRRSTADLYTRPQADRKRRAMLEQEVRLFGGADT